MYNSAYLPSETPPVVPDYLIGSVRTAFGRVKIWWVFFQFFAFFAHPLRLNLLF